MASRVIPVDPFDLIIFGGTGDLARRKILPGLFRRFRAGQMPPDVRIIGAARSEMDDAGYRDLVTGAIAVVVCISGESCPLIIGSPAKSSDDGSRGRFDDGHVSPALGENEV